MFSFYFALPRHHAAVTGLHLEVSIRMGKVGIERSFGSSYCCSSGTGRTGLEEQKIMKSFALVMNRFYEDVLGN